MTHQDDKLKTFSVLIVISAAYLTSAFPSSLGKKYLYYDVTMAVIFVLNSVVHTIS